MAFARRMMVVIKEEPTKERMVRETGKPEPIHEHRSGEVPEI